tara:strand:- start:328 stop:465 length:138 start_codon:yes stop_codon:yes gene_type:complete
MTKVLARLEIEDFANAIVGHPIQQPLKAGVKLLFDTSCVQTCDNA